MVVVEGFLTKGMKILTCSYSNNPTKYWLLHAYIKPEMFNAGGEEQIKSQNH